MRRLSRRSGFSLVELLTVIAIIAILAAIIFPVMGMVKERARQTGCMTNMKQIGIGLGLYKQDNRRYPVALVPVVRDASGNVVPFDGAKSDAGLMGEYVKGGITVFHCPSSKVTSKTDFVTQDKGTTKVEVYKFNSYEGLTDITTPAFEQHYCIDWWAGSGGTPTAASPSQPDGNTDAVDYKRQLKFRNPPDDTVVTWCSNHETREGGVTSPTSVRGKAIVLFMGGECLQMDAGRLHASMWRTRQQ